MDELGQAKKDLEQQLRQTKEDLHENNGKFGKEVSICLINLSSVKESG